MAITPEALKQPGLQHEAIGKAQSKAGGWGNTDFYSWTPITSCLLHKAVKEIVWWLLPCKSHTKPSWAEILKISRVERMVAKHTCDLIGKSKCVMKCSAMLVQCPVLISETSVATKKKSLHRVNRWKHEILNEWLPQASSSAALHVGFLLCCSCAALIPSAALLWMTPSPSKSPYRCKWWDGWGLFLLRR